MIVRRAEPRDYEALHRLFSGPRVIAGTLQLPLPSAEMWRQRLSEPQEGTFSLVACVEDEVVGEISLLTTPPAGACVTSPASAWQYATTGRARA
jgi:L-phenylalanine/L-methionine N-acetyltransferase